MRRLIFWLLLGGALPGGFGAQVWTLGVATSVNVSAADTADGLRMPSAMQMLRSVMMPAGLSPVLLPTLSLFDDANLGPH